MEAVPPEGFVGFDELFDKGLVDATELSESGVVGRISVNHTDRRIRIRVGYIVYMHATRSKKQTVIFLSSNTYC